MPTRMGRTSSQSESVCEQGPRRLTGFRRDVILLLVAERKQIQFMVCGAILRIQKEVFPMEEKNKELTNKEPDCEELTDDQLEMASGGKMQDAVLNSSKQEARNFHVFLL